MKNTITIDVQDLKDYIFSVIKSSYTLGMAYVTTKPSFSAQDAIKRFQDRHWEDLKNIWHIKE